MCKTFGIQPSAYAKELYGPFLPPRLTVMDWYAFDVATAWTYYELLAMAHDDEDGGSGAPRTGSPNGPDRLNAPRASKHNPVAERGEGLHILGQEMPPWHPSHPRHRAYVRQRAAQAREKVGE